MPSPRLLAVSAALVAALGLAGCRYDPVPQATVDNLAPDPGSPGPTHRPGQPCLACHSKYQGATPLLAVGGTVYAKDATSGLIVGQPHVLVQIIDSGGDLRKACTNASGNFYVVAANWTGITFPLRAEAGGHPMSSIIGREGSCAMCHRLPDGTSLDKVTGAARDSAGVIVVAQTATDPSCGGTP